ncbi:MAG: helix-turn-helix domain-containing protein [Bacteroidaceae bacterium]|nr:helix-turn-helix domain-containing protein [Bacteroidaceae bacterium]
MKHYRRIALFIVHFSLLTLHTSTATAADSIDSLYQVICTLRHPSITTANQLMLLLDAEGTTDSLIHFDHHTDKEQWMATLHLYMAGHYYEQATNMSHTMQAARRAETAARICRDTATMTEALAYQAVAASRMGQLDVALEATREELRLDSLAADLPNLARAYNTLAGLSLQAGRLDDAQLYIRKAIEMERQLPDSSHLSVRYGVAAEIYAKAGDHQQALQYAQRAYELDRMSGNDVKTARRLAQMADIYDAMGDLKAAETFYLRSIEALRAAGEQKSLAISLKQLGQLYLQLHREEEAQRTLEECEAICRKTGNHYTLQQVCRLLAQAYTHSQPERALAYMQEALTLNDTLHSQRAEQLAQELRQQQEESIMQKAEVHRDTFGWRWYAFLLVIVAAALGILVGQWWGRRKQTQTQQTLPLACPSSAQELKTDRQGGGSAGSGAATSAPSSLEFLAKVAELYDQNLEKQRLSIDELAAEMCMSRSQFTRRISAATGMSASNYLNRLRMEKAQRLLKDTEKPISTIAYECGFDDTPYFCNLFKKLYRVTPMQYRIMPTTDKDGTAK